MGSALNELDNGGPNARAEARKCGTCRFFVVRNAEEAKLARVAKPESECRPGEWVFEGQRKVGCHGGAVRGTCQKWRERGAATPSVESTFVCALWAPGGPVLRRAGSPNRVGAVASPRATSESPGADAWILSVVGVVAGTGSAAILRKFVRGGK